MKVIKNFFKWLILASLILLIAFGFWVQDKYAVPVLMYHHVKARPIKELNVVTPKVFNKQMKFLRRFGYKVLTMDEYIQTKKNGGKFARNSVVITFDDGYEDNYQYAFPVLKDYNFSATIFIVSDLIGKHPLLNWKQVKEMDQYGITIASHTRHHRYLPNIIDDELKNEIEGSKKAIEQELGKEVKYFSYPTGGFSEEIKELAKQAGYLAAFTTNRGYDKSGQDLFELKRIRMNNSDNWLTLFAKFSGYYNLFRKSKMPYSEDDSLGIVNVRK